MLLDEKAEIWIYGYGDRGRNIAARLRQEKIEVCGFIDRNPQQYEEEAKRVCILPPQEAKPSPDHIIICSITNVFVHKEIAEQLAGLGFRYIVYKSFLNNEAGKRVNRLYDILTSVLEDARVKGLDVPEYMETVRRSEQEDTNSGGVRYANIPVELLFGITRTYLDRSLLMKDKYILDTIPEKSILYYTPPQKMMQYFEGEVDEALWERCRELWFRCRNAQTFTSLEGRGYSEAEQNKNLDDRYVIFQKMDQLFCENPMFFAENPVSVLWNERGWFNIEDGNNRAAFLLAKGVYTIPARMTAGDYQAWRKTDEMLGPVRHALNNITDKLRSPILHPAFKEIPSELNYYSHKKTASICAWLWRQQIDPNELSICEYYCSNDLCGSHLARMGGSLTVVDTEEQLALHRALDKLYRLGPVCYGEQRRRSYRIILLNRVSDIRELIEKELRAEWYILECVDMKDSEINAAAASLSNKEPEYLMRQLAGSKIFKVILIKGEKI